MDVLILDLTHGGDIIARKLKDDGHRVTVVDIYHLSSPQERKSLVDEDILVFDVSPAEDFDLLISPIHCPDFYISPATFRKRRFFSEIVGDLIGPTPFRIEITGVKGKTSTCHILAHLLSENGKRVLLHTSRGRELIIDGDRIMVSSEVSIAPPSLLRPIEMNVDYVVNEVSLGGSGKADMAIITNLADNYPIAGDTRLAREAKSSILTERGVNLFPQDELEIWQTYDPVNVHLHGSSVRLDEHFPLQERQPISISLSKVYRICLSNKFLSSAFLQSIEIAATAAALLGIPEEGIVKSLETFPGVPGRCEIHPRNGGFLIVEKNPGISHLSIEHVLSNLSKHTRGAEITVLITPATKKVCEKMEMEPIKKVVKDYGANLMIIPPKTENDYDLLFQEHKIVVHFQKEAYQ